jgi:hypothetical protein
LGLFPEKLVDRYGSVQVASLVEKHNNEAIVGDYYQKKMDQLNETGGVTGKPVGFEWFDFHAICRGMKFENVSILMESLGKILDSFGDTVEVDGKQLSKQSGILRTNCMDCLDRTNVVQSACGRRALELQLKDVSILKCFLYNKICLCVLVFGRQRFRQVASYLK